jgi:septin family protein
VKYLTLYFDDLNGTSLIELQKHIQNTLKERFKEKEIAWCGNSDDHSADLNINLLTKELIDKDMVSNIKNFITRDVGETKSANLSQNRKVVDYVKDQFDIYLPVRR